MPCCVAVASAEQASEADLRCIMNTSTGCLVLLAVRRLAVSLPHEAGASPSACLDHSAVSEILIYARTVSYRACATPGPSTICSRPMHCRASSPRPRAIYNREELRPLAQTNVNH